MSLRYLLDTNILSEVIKPNPSLSVLARINQHKFELATASIVVHEFVFGYLRLSTNSKRRANLKTYIDQVILNTLPIFPYDTTAALWHSEQRALLTTQGKTPPFADGQIAAIAKVNT